MKSAQEQFAIIKKGASQIISEEGLMEKLLESVKEERPLIIKFGLDPSAPDIHLGHTVALRKIRQMQDLGHKAVIIIGDFTGQIGDPTGRSKGRKALSKEQVRENAATYMEQIFKVIDPSKTEVRFNSEWLEKLNFEDVIRLASTTTVARMLERDDFKKRYQENVPIGLHEFFYPLMQAYDSVQIHADIELGGTEQTFNVLMGRALQKAKGEKEQTAIFMPLLEGLDGVEKMSKSLGNYICVDEEPEVMFKKVMEVPDSLIIRYFTLVTDVSMDAIKEMEKEMEEGRNPREVKLMLAKEITRIYHGEEAMLRAEKYFETVFREGRIPDQMPEIMLSTKEDTLISIIPRLMELKLIPSGSEFRRLISQGGVTLNEEKVFDINRMFVEKENVLKIGKKKFVRLLRL
ncbi:MAG: tyrosine--tRNA ligase [Lachnospiraceae bacterium]|nr:tyrosine--tRNA ligase [Lachnospiraceae bacterium]